MCHLCVIYVYFLDLSNWGSDFITDCEMPAGESPPRNINKFWNRISNRLDIFEDNMHRFAQCD